MKTVTVSDATLLNLAKDSNARKRVPLLQAVYNAMRKKKGGCGTCAKRAKLSQSVIAVRTALAKTPASLLALKQLLKADKLVLYIRGPKGKTQRREV